MQVNNKGIHSWDGRQGIGEQCWRWQNYNGSNDAAVFAKRVKGWVGMVGKKLWVKRCNHFRATKQGIKSTVGKIYNSIKKNRGTLKKNKKRTIKTNKKRIRNVVMSVAIWREQMKIFEKSTWTGKSKGN